MKKTKILFLLHLPPPVHGSSMVGKWIKDSTVINNTFNCFYINLLASKKVSDSGKVTFAKLWGMVMVGWLLIKKLIKQKPDICYLALTTTGPAFYRDVLLVTIMKIFGVKRTYHLHNKGVAKAAKNKINHWMYAFVFSKAKVILLSEHLYQDIQEFVSIENIHICPNGIPKSTISDKKEIKEDKTPVILFLSNLIESKGVFVLLEALHILKKKKIAFKGIFVGGEGDINTIQFNRKKEELGLSDQVEYLGRKYDKEKETIFKQADIFAFPTHYSNECFPLVLLEAMQVSLPILSTNEGGISSIIEEGKTGFLIPQKNSKVLAEKLQILIEQPELRVKMGQEGFKKYNEEFILTKFEENLTSILNKTIAKC
ncbi:glycosyltransferase family 4 protein [Wenyingzhuangia sp. IMCC45467]